jgi:hypothetical protein
VAPSGDTVDRRRACRRQIRRQGLRGEAAKAQVAVCVAEAQLACAKAAADRKLGQRERRAFVRNCMGKPERKRSKRKREGRS